MLSKIRPPRNCQIAIFAILLILVFNVIIPESFAQTPNLAGRGASGAPESRPRLVLSPRKTDADGPPLQKATPIERRAFELINKARQEKGLSPLGWDSGLCRMARSHSEDMAQRRFFSHETPDGLRMNDRARSFGIEDFKLLAENIAANQGFDDPGAFAVEQWLRSPGHRANILNPRFEQSAIGVSVGADGTVFLTQEFITR
jgi:uncharacterized protein YkwD